MRSTPTGRRPLPALGLCGSISEHNSPHGTTCSISSRNNARFVFFEYRWNPVCSAKLACFISPQPLLYLMQSSSTCSEFPLFAQCEGKCLRSSKEYLRSYVLEYQKHLR